PRRSAFTGRQAFGHTKASGTQGFWHTDTIKPPHQASRSGNAFTANDEGVDGSAFATQSATTRYHFGNFAHARVNNLSETSHSRRDKNCVSLRASTQRSADHVTAKACSVHRGRPVVWNQAA